MIIVMIIANIIPSAIKTLFNLLYRAHIIIACIIALPYNNKLNENYFLGPLNSSGVVLSLSAMLLLGGLPVMKEEGCFRKETVGVSCSPYTTRMT